MTIKYFQRRPKVDIINRLCAKCGANSGELCRTKSGKKASEAHSVRFKLGPKADKGVPWA